MTDNKMRKLLSAALDGELSTKKRAYVISKLRKDARWQAEYEELKELKSLVKGVGKEEVLELSCDFDKSLMMRLGEYGNTCDSFAYGFCEGEQDEKKNEKRRERRRRRGYVVRIKEYIDDRIVDGVLFEKIAYSLGFISFIFMLYVGYEVYNASLLLNRADKETVGNIVDSVISGSVGEKGAEGSVRGKEWEGNNAGDVAGDDKEVHVDGGVDEKAFTTVMNREGKLFVRQNSSTLIVDMYSGKAYGDIDYKTKDLRVRIMSNLDIYKKIYRSHYPESPLFSDPD